MNKKKGKVVGWKEGVVKLGEKTHVFEIRRLLAA